MYYYKCLDKLLLSSHEYTTLQPADESEVKQYPGILYYLYAMDPFTTRKSFSISDASLLYLKEEGLHLLQFHQQQEEALPSWLLKKIEERKVMGINTAFPNWRVMLHHQPPQKWRIHIAGLGDVGGTLLTGLRLLGGAYIDAIGIYDKASDKLKRWCYEVNQVYSSGNHCFPEIDAITEDEMFRCDMFVFCIAKAVPPIGEEAKDVRMIQFEENAKIIRTFAKRARTAGFKGIFAVVSDPVDLLCKVVLDASNTDELENYDFQGLAPEQIRGYGLGVMYARALYFAKENPKTSHFMEEGRAFGPHGEDLIIADSIENYNESLSLYLTNKAKTANLEIRDLGFKPYIAPALSSGSLSILATIKGDWHYSATYIGGVYMGSRNRLNSSGVEIERLSLPDLLFNRLKNTYDNLRNVL
ncbi:lactate/malate family dehydrogenase [Clostridium formicaceticum]|uniref:L-lactate dehydrogenase 2 n=1 Tax=Clostridium formicaceticum TaxID=1497 RepID=A0AAC9WFH9_9CLOT|nr:lactate dehydrogenase [Clostridium formicaceticum]ARE86818.1 L-lactate dehydrogenase 2 [Clostridium formicaceticum]